MQSLRCQFLDGLAASVGSIIIAWIPDPPRAVPHLHNVLNGPYMYFNFLLFQSYVFHAITAECSSLNSMH